MNTDQHGTCCKLALVVRWWQHWLAGGPGVLVAA